MAIPDRVERKLNESLWGRPDGQHLTEVFAKLGIIDSDDFAEFFRRFWGPFRSDSIGYELLDVVEQEESILPNTEIVRQEFGFLIRFIFVTNLPNVWIFYQTAIDISYKYFQTN